MVWLNKNTHNFLCGLLFIFTNVKLRDMFSGDSLHSCWSILIYSEVYIDFYMLAINELSETTETLKTTGYLFVNWNDTFLKWDPNAYGGLSLYQFPQVI